MRLPKERLLFHALCVLEDAAEEAMRVGRVTPRASVRLALATLYAFSRDTDGIQTASWHRTFWKTLTAEDLTNSRTSQGFGRSQSLTSSLNGIARAAGMPRDHDYDAARRELLRREGRYPR